MKKDTLPEKLKQKLVLIMRDHSLAKFGDSLVNFAYSYARTKVMEKPIGECVFDKALAEAVKKVGLRSVMQSSASAGDIGDGAEALVGYGYLNDIISLEEIVEGISQHLVQTKNEPQDRKWERENMLNSMAIVLQIIRERIEATLN